MSNQPISTPPATGPAGGGAPSPAQPNVSPEVLQQLIDRAASFNIFSIPDPKNANVATPVQGSSNDVIGFKIHENLHRFVVTVRPPEAGMGLVATNTVGELTGQFSHRWMLMPDDFAASPNREPPPTRLDPSRSQRFVMLDSVCKFGDGLDGFRGFGTGKTFPVMVNGRPQLVAAAIGVILEGFGKFKDHTEAIYMHCGTISPQRGFMGELSLRVMDPEGTLYTTDGLSDITPEPDPEPGITYILIRGQGYPADAFTPILGPQGQVRGLKADERLKILELDYSAKGHRGLRSVTKVGQIIGVLSGEIIFDISDPGGTTPFNPIPFTTYNTITFYDREGRNIGSFGADLVEGRTFYMEIPGAPGTRGIRFGGFGPLMNGTGFFKGIEGMMTDNTVANFTPHVAASIYMFRIHDPDGRYRAAFNNP
jgi:hypothetical protein